MWSLNGPLLRDYDIGSKERTVCGENKPYLNKSMGISFTETKGGAIVDLISLKSLPRYII
ncbi:MAG: hypothetical protein ACI87H_002499 [Gammaproteobacteria bacterium]|jgi:hypothetical protein